MFKTVCVDWSFVIVAWLDSPIKYEVKNKKTKAKKKCEFNKMGKRGSSSHRDLWDPVCVCVRHVCVSVCLCASLLCFFVVGSYQASFIGQRRVKH